MLRIIILEWEEDYEKGGVELQRRTGGSAYVGPVDRIASFQHLTHIAQTTTTTFRTTHTSIAFKVNDLI